MRAIDASRWREIQALFNEVVDLDETTRSDRLDVVGQSDPELRESVESLLRGDAEADARLAGMDDVLSPRGHEGSTPMRGAIDPLRLCGRMVSHFRVLEPIAIGGMGVVYRAEDTLLGRAVALKLPLPGRWFERDARERFVREGRAAGGLDHPNVCAIHEVGETDDGHLYIAMALYPGETLAARIAREGALSVSDALSIARSIARGLAAAHAAGIIHRDVKPANVMLLPEGGVKVLDFGLAKPRDVSITGPRAMMGTVAYMAPEQIRGAPVDARADVWALGVVLYEMLTGRRPFDGERDITVAHAILHDEPTPPRELRPDLSPVVEAVVHSLLQKDREQRPATAESVDAHLAAAELGRSSDIPSSRARSRRRTMSARQRLGAGAAALVLLGGAGAMLATRQPRDRPKEFVVVADFETPPADSQIADVLTDVTRRALSASRSLSAAPDNQILLARQRLGVPAGARITRELARQLALGVGIRSVVSGSLRSFSGGYAVSLHLISAASGQVLATAEAPVTNLRDPFAALDTVTRRLREQAGDDLEAIRAQPPAPALTSTSLEAMMDYATALRLPPDSVARAVALLREAVALDTSFASAYWRLSFFMEPTSPRAEAEHRALLAKAWAHRDGLTEYERLRVEIAYKYSPDGTAADVGRHIERLRQVVDRYPNAGDAMILADLYLGKRDIVEAERMYRLAAALDSTKPDAQSGLINTYLKANRVREARRAVDVLTHTFPGMRSDGLDAVVWYAEGRPDRARDVMRRLAGSIDTNSRVFGYIQLSMLELRNGRVSAWDSAIRAKDSLVGMRPSAPGLRSTRLLAAYWVSQDPARGLRMLDSSVAGSPALRFSLDAAEFYAQLGAPDSARALMAARGPSHRSIYVQGTDTLPVYAWIDLAEGRPLEAAAKFRASLRFSGGSAPSQISRDAEMGLAFERAGMADSAIAVYEHYLNAVPLWEQDAFKRVWVLEHVASLYEAKGDHRKARTAYARVAELWKDADPVLQPRVTHARERGAALQ